MNVYIFYYFLILYALLWNVKCDIFVIAQFSLQ